MLPLMMYIKLLQHILENGYLHKFKLQKKIIFKPLRMKEC